MKPPAQATNTPLTLGHELTILAVAMLTSKGAGAVAGGGFITLAATLQVVPAIKDRVLAVQGSYLLEPLVHGHRHSVHFVAR